MKGETIGWAWHFLRGGGSWVHLLTAATQECKKKGKIDTRISVHCHSLCSWGTAELSSVTFKWPLWTLFPQGFSGKWKELGLWDLIHLILKSQACLLFSHVTQRQVLQTLVKYLIDLVYGLGNNIYKIPSIYFRSTDGVPTTTCTDPHTWINSKWTSPILLNLMWIFSLNTFF